MKTYTVKEGKNRFQPNIWSLKQNRIRLEGKAAFDSSCWYDQQYLPTGEPYDGQNKLIGLQLHLSKKHYRDALFSWACKDGIIGVGPYWDIPEEDKPWWREPTITVAPDEDFYWKIELSTSKNTVDLFLRKEESDWIRDRRNTDVGCWTWILQPHFGGQLPTKQQMKLKLEFK